MMNAVVWACTGTSLLALLVWMIRHLELARVRRVMPSLHARMYPQAGDDLPRVSILVAAKDEESTIDACLQSLNAQDYPDFEIIAVNDRSTDRTGEIIDGWAAGGRRRSAVHVHETRPGWFGKTNAMREGIDRARGDWLCFTDADCVFVSPRALTVAMHHARAKGADALSVLPVHRTSSFWERLIQPACSGILMIWFNPLRVNDPKSTTAYANGAFILISRDCYNAAGGFEAVKNRINEDMQLARLVKKTGHRLVIVPNDDLYTVRMYESFAAIWAGWTRIFYGSFDSLRRLALSILLVAVFSLLPWVSLGCGAALLLLNTAVSPVTWVLTGTALAACLAQTTVMCRFYAVNRSHPIYGLFYPVAAVLGLAILLNAMFRRAVGGTVTWRGTAYRDVRGESDHTAERVARQ